MSPSLPAGESHLIDSLPGASCVQKCQAPRTESDLNPAVSKALPRLMGATDTDSHNP